MLLHWRSASIWRRGSLELVNVLDTVLDKDSEIYEFCREENGAFHNVAMIMHAECTALWREWGAPQKRQNLIGAMLSQVPWRTVFLES